MAVAPNLKYRHNTRVRVSLHNFCKQPQQLDFHFKISGFLAAVELTDKSGYPDNGYPDMQTLAAWYLRSAIFRVSARTGW